MPSTTNFGWTTPADSDYVKDGASAIRTLAGGIDTSMAQLKGGTTGQVLSKTNGTDMSFTWITPQVGDITSVGVTSPITGGGTGGDVTIAIQDATTAQKGAVQLTDSTSSTSTTTAATPNSVKTAYDLANAAIAKSLVDAKGDIIVATADNTVARQAVGTNNYTLLADSSQTNGLKWAVSATSTLTTKGDLLGASAANTLERIAVGTDGQVLTADSASTAGIKWASAASGGGMTSIASGSLSSNTVTISTISNSYNNLQLIVRDFYCTGDDYLNIRFNGDTGNNYGWTSINQAAEDTVQTWADGVRDRMFANYQDMDNTDNNNAAIITVHDYANTSTFKLITIQSVIRDSGNSFYANSLIIGNFRSTSAVSSITMFSQNTNNFSGGTYVLYGVK